MLSHKVTASAVLIALGALAAWLLLRDGAARHDTDVSAGAQPVQRSLQSGDLAEVDDSASSGRSAASSVADEALERSAAEPATGRTCQLIVHLSFDGAPPLAGFELTVLPFERTSRLRTETLTHPGTFTFDLTETLRDLDPIRSRLLVGVNGSGFIESGGWATHARVSDTDTFTISLTPTAVLRTITGRLLTSATGVKRGARVYFVPSALGAAVTDAAPLSTASVQSDGHFELHLDHLSPGQLAGAVPGHTVAHIDLDASAGGEVDVGDIEIRGSTEITGTAFAQGERLGASAAIRATIAMTADDAPARNANRLIVFEGQVAWHEVMGHVNDDGHFRVRGLQPGLEYRLVALPEWDGRGLVAGGAMGTLVTAPARDVVLEDGLESVQLVVRSGDEPVPLPRVRELRDSIVPGPEDERVFGIGDQQGRINVMLVPGQPLRVEVSALGHEAQIVTVDAPSIGGQRERVVELVPVEASCTLIVKFRLDGTASLNGTTARLMHGAVGPRPGLHGPVEIAGEEARFEGVPPGATGAVVVLYHSPSTPCAELPYSWLPPQTMDLAGSRAGDVVTRTLDAPSGGRIALTVSGVLSPSGPARFELTAVAGHVYPARVYVDSTAGGHTTVREMRSNATYTFGPALPPGGYTLRQSDSAYEFSEVEVKVRGDETTAISIALKPR